MTRRDIMLLSTAMLSYQMSKPQVCYQVICYYCIAFDWSGLALKGHMPQAYAAASASKPSFTTTIARKIFFNVQESKAAGLPGPFADFFSPTQPDPVLFPRKALDQVFAVLLMRSAYEAVDDLNFIPMVRAIPRLVSSSLSWWHMYPM